MEPYERAVDWLGQDPDPETRAALQSLLDRDDRPEILRLFTGDLVFGTAGLRAPLGFGPLCMNRVVVARAAAGLAQYLLKRHAAPRVVIGFDARHKSAEFAQETAEVLQGAGVEALLLHKPLPTPVLAFAIRHLNTDAAVMVTASHNPASDNGYKVYLGDATQITTPADVHIAAHIASVSRIDTLPRSSDYTTIDDAEAAYLAALSQKIPVSKQRITIAYTPMHGVGAATFLAAAKRTGFDTIHVVEEQHEPDPDFPTLLFPNPEEDGAMDRVLALARQRQADIALAHDPDADRLAAAFRTDDGFRMLTGDELGALLAQRLLKHGVRGTFANSIVSSRLLGDLAAAHQQPWVQTLTGFKWIGKVEGLAYGYEEALGYCVRPDLSGDKDGISAALLLLSYANELHAAGRTLGDELDDMARTHGVYATAQVSMRGADQEHLARMLAQFMTEFMTEFTTDVTVDVTAEVNSQSATAASSKLAHFDVTHIHDLSTPEADLPTTPGIILTLEPKARVICRPSGTEAKLKCYVEVRTPVANDLAAARAAATEQLSAITSSLRAHLTRISAATRELVD